MNKAKKLTGYQKSILERMKSGYVLEAGKSWSGTLGVFHLHRPKFNDWIPISICTITCLKERGAIVIEDLEVKSADGHKFMKCVASVKKQ